MLALKTTNYKNERNYVCLSKQTEFKNGGGLFIFSNF